MKNISNYIILLLAAAMWQCEPNIDEFSPSKGVADFTKFVAIGDSYTAGYSDGALSKKGQENSFVNIMAKQMKNVGLADFKQPLLPEGKSIGSAGNGSFYLVKTANPVSPVAPFTQVPGNVELLSNPLTWINGQYQNVGVPGAKTFHLLTPSYGDPALGAGNFNPFYARFASQPGTSTMLSDALSNNPTFFSCWLAGNDILGYVLAGGEGGVGIGNSDITDNATFTVSMNALLTGLTANGAKGVIGNIPDIEAIPYVSYISYNGLVFNAADAGKVAALNAAYDKQYNLAAKQYNLAAKENNLSEIHFVIGENRFVIKDEKHPLGARQINEGEKILLSALSNILNSDPDPRSENYAWGSFNPIPIKHTLDDTELGKIKAATASFNGILKDLAKKYDIAFADANALMDELKEGLLIDGNKYTATFVTGGGFSLDGIHLTNRGSAMIANEFIKAINAKYKATIPLADINDYDLVEFP